MGKIQIDYLSNIDNEEKKAIIYRSSLELGKVMSEVIEPLAADLREQTKEKILKYTEKWDKTRPDPLVLTQDDLKNIYNKLNKERPEVIAAFASAAENITEFHKQQIPVPLETQVGANKLGLKFVPFDRVALYVPGGKARYPSSVLMGIIPAKIAGVKDITIISPPDPATGKTPEVVQAIAHMAGADRIVQAGGAQAVIGMAYGIPEEEVQPVDFIYGPGNVFVAAAKNFVFSNNLCGIDSFAGPSEVLIISDETANPAYLAHDLLAQAEHDENASAILLTTSIKSANETVEHIEKALQSRNERRKITSEAMERNGRILVVDSLEEAIEFSNLYAPEHLEIQTKEDETILSKITAAGSVFVGPHAPVAVGDYFSGTNHILPTNRGARFSSGVSVHTFFRRITYQYVSREGLEASKDPITIMSKEEGLFDEHGYSVLARFENSDKKVVKTDGILDLEA
ncbi:MAG: histidinol dehydrogenase [Leptospirales bacterium]